MNSTLRFFISCAALCAAAVSSNQVLAAPCRLEGSYTSTTLLATLLAGNPALTIRSESTTLQLSRGAITVAADASLESSSGGIVFSGDGALRGSARYRVVTRGRRSFLVLSNIRRDVFTVRTYVNGVLSSERELSGVVFGDREVQFRCRGSQLELNYDVSGSVRQVTYTRR